MAGLVDFKNEEEVKDYLDNLGTEYSYQCFKEKQPDGCNRLAEYFENIKKNFESAAGILKINCDQNEHSESFYKLGAYYVTGKGGLPVDLKAAYSCFLKSCNKGGKKSIDSCHNVGLLAHDGRVNDEKADAVTARDYYNKACDGNFAASCFNLSATYLQGAPGIPKDMNKALHFSEKACSLGHVWGCANASRMYKLGDGVAKNDEKAESLKNRARDLHKMQQERTPQISFGE
ncbi:cytochrome c oxidase assembly factor 7A [Xenopus laevis]|uniref:Cytochrome c oxidase assembly factor 7A n=1 Tax=Xenopus laevis TaxID=8355 RepID=COA7A_XENLA|nr:cytochrome c oxidase assembly factor 7A [Xenopus laevis]Q66KY0.1 RecName: Full=Cytochrome c oxidase assembly factor 7A; AltName: Full=Beta-lactamase hcp-like protein; AltName: Full=Sel1 repeat-containing protein 1A [Xenopus laevis]AAH78519.1 MGC85335 protein [Xenopus laevis]